MERGLWRPCLYPPQPFVDTVGEGQDLRGIDNHNVIVGIELDCLLHMTPRQIQIADHEIGFGGRRQDEGIVGVEADRPFGEIPGQSPGFVDRREVGEDAVAMAIGQVAEGAGALRIDLNGLFEQGRGLAGRPIAIQQMFAAQHQVIGGQVLERPALDSLHGSRIDLAGHRRCAWGVVIWRNGFVTFVGDAELNRRMVKL